MSTPALRRRGAMRQDLVLRITARDDASDGKCTVQFDAAKADALGWDVRALPLQFARPVEMDLLRPDRIKGARVREMEQEQSQGGAGKHRGVEDGEFDCGNGGTDQLLQDFSLPAQTKDDG